MSSTSKRTSKVVKNTQDLDKFFNITHEDITTTFIMDTFGDFGNGPKYNPYDLITVPIGKYSGKAIQIEDNKVVKEYEKSNKNAFTTTLGRYIFNKFFILQFPSIFHIIGYLNQDMTKKNYGKLFDTLGYKLMEKKIKLDEYKTFAICFQKFMPYVSILSPNHTDTMLKVSAKINKKKEELLKKNAKAIEANDALAVSKISDELLDYARELLKDDPAMDVFNSGAGGSFDNNFKNIFVMRGAVKDPDPTKGYNIITSNFIDGCKKEEYSMLANSLAAGPYARSKKTELGGYWEKLIMAATQHIVLLPAGSDCGTKRTISIKVTDKNIDILMYSYVMVNERPVEITSENRDSFIGKRVNLRYMTLCESKNGICNTCAGNLFYREGIKNVGAAAPQIASKLKVRSMKLFHDDQVVFSEMDPMKAFCPDD